MTMFMEFYRKHAHALLTDSFPVPWVLVILTTGSPNELLFLQSGFKESQEGHVDFMCNLVETEEYFSLEIAPLRP